MTSFAYAINANIHSAQFGSGFKRIGQPSCVQFIFKWIAIFIFIYIPVVFVYTVGTVAVAVVVVTVVARAVSSCGRIHALKIITGKGSFVFRTRIGIGYNERFAIFR